MLVMFCGPYEVNLADLQQEAASHTKTMLAPEAAIILVPFAQAKAITDKMLEVSNALLALNHSEHVSIFTYNQCGHIEYYNRLKGEPVSVDMESLKRQGLTQLFRKRGGLLEAGPTAHFVKPSNHYDKRFLRAAHALSEGPEIFFVALWLLPLFDPSVRAVHLDTSDISSVAFAAIAMRELQQIPMISTFHSYQGLEAHNFAAYSKAITIISASQSGGMAEKIRKSQPEISNKIVTLFSLDFTERSGISNEVVCDLRFDAELNPEGFSEIVRVSEQDRTRPIELVSQHFLARPQPSNCVVPSEADAPKEVKEFIAKLQGQGIIRVLINEADLNAPAVDLEFASFAKNDLFKKWIRDVVAQNIPATTRSIWIEDDPTSLGIADALNDEYSVYAHSPRRFNIEKIKDINGESPLDENRSPFIVIEGVTSNGQALLEASRKLRNYAPNSHRIYLTVAAFPESGKNFGYLRSNLKHRGHHVGVLFHLPIKREVVINSWNEERKIIKKILSHFDGSVEGKVFEERNNILRSQYRGDELFLEGCNGALKLRNNFAFWPVEKCNNASQADVFVTAAALLENMRNGDAKNKLINDVHSHSVIGTETFGRYNDGVIQAAILRAAYREELNYAGSVSESASMSSFILQLVDLWDQNQGEAVNEFLLALATQRIKLHHDHIDAFKAKLEKKILGKNGVGDILIKEYLGQLGSAL